MEEKETIQPEAKPEIRPQKSLRGILRWLMVVLSAFGLGALLIIFAFFTPIRKELKNTSADLENANATITSQNDQITTLQAGNETLQKDLDSARLQRVLLEALTGVQGTSLAVANGDYAGARLTLIQASETLDSLSTLLGAEHRDVLVAMQQSASQALVKMKINLSSAQPELDQLTNNLVKLENNLFPIPYP